MKKILVVIVAAIFACCLVGCVSPSVLPLNRDLVIGKMMIKYPAGWEVSTSEDNIHEIKTPCQGAITIHNGTLKTICPEDASDYYLLGNADSIMYAIRKSDPGYTFGERKVVRHGDTRLVTCDITYDSTASGPCKGFFTVVLSGLDQYSMLLLVSINAEPVYYNTIADMNSSVVITS